jgi:hypothetical protein
MRCFYSKIMSRSEMKLEEWLIVLEMYDQFPHADAI